MTDSQKLSRRSAIAGAGGLVVAAPLLAACGTSATDTTGPAERTGSNPRSKKAPQHSTGTTAPPLTTTKKVPVGGGLIFAQQRIVVTQPQAGTIKAFSAVCTHQGCLVSQITGDSIECPCHGSLFSIKDGSVVRGPATDPLRPVGVTVAKNGDVTTSA